MFFRFIGDIMATFVSLIFTIAAALGLTERQTKWFVGILITIGILAVTGWVMNLVALAHATAMSGMVVLRVLGIFAFPLGAIVGWF